jgi:outer membrane protein assembly factor BamA
MNRFLLVLLLILSFEARAEITESYAPILGYNPNSGLILGAAAFLKSPDDYLDLEAMGTLANVYAAVLNYRRSLDAIWILEMDNNVSSFYDLYYGEGMNTQVSNQVQLDQLKYLGELHLDRIVGNGLSFGPLVYDRVRRETGINGDDSLRLIPGEDTYEFGIEAKLDRRDNEFSPTKGYYFEAEALNHPTPLDDGGNFSQAQVDLRDYQSLGPIIFAGHLLGDYSWGNPSYMYRYSLGGSDLLRGYYGNRFRGKNLAAAQLEARFPIWHCLSGDVFADSGEVADGPLDGDIETTGGAGLRIALPPSGMMKARIDYGISKDQSGIYVAFGHAF